MARIVSVTVGRKSELEVGNRFVETGIDKRPTTTPVRVGTLGLESDVVSDTDHHGGPDQAVYVYFAEDYAFWADALGRPLAPGLFGENLVIDGLGEHDIAVGDRFVAHEVVLEVTAPRIPCSILAARMADPGFVKAFQQAMRPGFYTRVVRKGTIAAGESVGYAPSGAITIRELYTEWYAKPHDADTLRRALEAPVASRTRKKLETWLEELTPER